MKSGLEQELAMKLSLDGELVSVNALELLTREHGDLSKAIKSIATDVISRHKQAKQSEINQEIVSELSEVKSMLDAKAKELARQEREI